MKKPQIDIWYKHGLSTVLICVLVSLVISNVDMFSDFNEAWIDRDVRQSGYIGSIYFVFVSSVMMAIGAPRQFAAFLGGYAFGVGLGFLLSILAAILGCIMTFFTSKLIIKPIIRHNFDKQASYVDNILQHHPIRKTIIIRLLPVGSNLLTNLTAGATSVKPNAFFIGSLIGYIPQMFVFSLLGKGLLIGSEWKIGLSVLLLVISSFLSFRLYRNIK